jgi:hypothetical protein
MSAVISVTRDDFSAGATRDGASIIAWLKGTADYAALDDVDLLLSRVHAEATRHKVKETVIDLRQLEFMNSSCFKSFISWVTDIQDLSEAVRYKVRLLSNPNLHWQKRSLHSLRCFAIELITIEVKA